MPRILAILAACAATATLAGEHTLRGDFGFDSNGCPNGGMDEDTLAVGAGYEYQSDSRRILAELRRAPSRADCSKPSGQGQVMAEQGFGPQALHALVRVGYERRSVVDRVMAAGPDVYGHYRNRMLGIGAGVDVGPVHLSALYNGTDDRTPLHVGASVTAWGITLGSEARCPQIADAASLLNGCFLESEARIGRDFAGSRLGMELTVRHRMNWDTMNRHYKWRGCGMEADCPALPDNNVEAMVGVRYRF